MGSVLSALNTSAGVAASAAGAFASDYAGAGNQLATYIADISKGILIVAAAGLGAGIVLSLVGACRVYARASQGLGFRVQGLGLSANPCEAPALGNQPGWQVLTCKRMRPGLGCASGIGLLAILAGACCCVSFSGLHAGLGGA